MPVCEPSGGLTWARFREKWSRAALPERAASQEHFLDLCRLLRQPTPAEADASGTEYTFEKAVAVTDAASRGSKGDRGFVDVWWRGKFAWEYKRKGKYRDLTDAYRQLCQYREDLENPPLLIVSDIARIEIHTNFTGFKPLVHTVPLQHVDHAENLALLRRAFTDPRSFRPCFTPEQVTREIAEQIGRVAVSLQAAGHEPHDAAHFLMKCMFCLFAEDIQLLPESLFTRLLEKWHDQPGELTGLLGELFAKMRTGGAFGMEAVPHFNGGLFDDAPALPLTRAQATALLHAARQDWSAVEPAVFGTLFERSLDPSKRAQIGAHYTSREDILLVIEPVILAPLRRRWQAVQEEIDKQLARRRRAKTDQTKRKANEEIDKVLREFMDYIGSLRILDPACGSGNFLYVAIQELLDLEREVIRYAASPKVGAGLFIPNVRPAQLHGLEINPYAAELAQVVIWIGYLQWMHHNGFNVPRNPILEPLQTIECRDAILDLSDPDHPKPAEWPNADFIVGNPPFLGSKLFRQQGLPDDYIEAMFGAYDIPNSSDLCCYWFERARQEIELSKGYGGKGYGRGPYGSGPSGGSLAPNLRVGLLATQGIRGGANRAVLERIKETGDIFAAWSDRNWILDGAAVHVSIVGFDAGSEQERFLDGIAVDALNTDLSGGANLSVAAVLREDKGLSYMGVTPSGKFEVPVHLVAKWSALPNATGRNNAAVLRPWINARDITQRERGSWIIDFGCDVDEASASQFEGPFEHVVAVVAPRRAKYRTGKRAYWCFERPRPAMREALSAHHRYIATPMVSKHCMFTWRPIRDLCANLIIAFARSDDYFFGVLHSSVHELWALRMGTQLEDRPRYTPTTCFETFPLPWAPGSEPEGDALWQRISAAAKALNDQRERWLNPPEWIGPIEEAVDEEDDFADVPEAARALIRRSAVMARAAKDARLKKRTLTNLYNERPTWLKLAHRELDAAVLSAYAAIDAEGGWCEEWADVWADTGAGRPLPGDHPLAARRAEIDPQVLANLLRLNLARAGGR